MADYLTCKQVAERYGVGIHTVRDWIKKKRLPALNLGGKAYRVRLSDLTVFEERYKTVNNGVSGNISETS